MANKIGIAAPHGLTVGSITRLAAGSGEIVIFGVVVRSGDGLPNQVGQSDGVGQ